MKRSTHHIDNTRNSNIIGMNNRWNSHNLIQMRQALNGSSDEGNDVDDDFSVSTTQLEINGSSTSSSFDGNNIMEEAGDNIIVSERESENNNNEIPVDETSTNGAEQKEKEIMNKNHDSDIDNFEQTNGSNNIDIDYQEGKKEETISNNRLEFVKSSFFDNNQFHSNEFHSPWNKYVGDLTVSLCIYKR